MTPEEVREFLNENRVRVEVVVLDDGGDTKYHDPLTPEEDERRQLLQNEFAEWTNENRGGYVGARPLTREERQELDGYMQRHRASIARQDEGRARATKYSQYQLPGGSNYREVLVTLPKKETRKKGIVRKVGDGPYPWKVFAGDAADGNHASSHRTEEEAMEAAKMDFSTTEKEKFRSTHFDEPNILVHLRLNDRTGPNGEKVLFIEELQSDWGQQGKKKGFKQKRQDGTEGWTASFEENKFAPGGGWWTVKLPNGDYGNSIGANQASSAEEAIRIIHEKMLDGLS